jgi:GxxExxY protein
MEGIQDKEETEQIIAAAIAVHRELGPGFLESIYEEALCVELDSRGIPYERQKRIQIPFKDHVVGDHRLDLLVAGKVVVELKAVKDIESIFFSIVRSYLKAAKVETGLLINFHAVPLAVKRVGREYYGQTK